MSNDLDLDALEAAVAALGGPVSISVATSHIVNSAQEQTWAELTVAGREILDEMIDEDEGPLFAAMGALLAAAPEMVRRLRSTLPARPQPDGDTEVAMWRAGELLIEACDLGIAIHDQLGVLDHLVDYGTAAAQRKRLQAIRDGEAAARPQPVGEPAAWAVVKRNGSLVDGHMSTQGPNLETCEGERVVPLYRWPAAQPAAEIERLVDALLEAQENATAGIPTDEEDEHEAAKGEVVTARTALLAALATPARADAANVREAEHFGAREGAEHLRAVAHQIERIAATLPPLATGGA